MDELLRAFGTPATASLLARLLDGDASAGRASALLEALAHGAPYGAPDANGRAVVEDLEQCLVEIGRRHPATLLLAFDQSPTLQAMFAMASAVAAIPGDSAADRLVRLLDSKNGAIRWLVLDALVARGDPRAVERLGKAIRDRDSLVVFAAVRALRRFGERRDIAALLDLAQAAGTAIGTREYAYDAIETIALRNAMPLPVGMQRRLVTVTLPPGAKVDVQSAQVVTTNMELARAETQVFIAPCDGVATAIDFYPDHIEVVIRRAP